MTSERQNSREAPASQESEKMRLKSDSEHT